MFNYQVFTEAQAMQERYNLLKEGIYDAVINFSTDKTSSSGNPMMDMTLAVYDDNGMEHNVRDFLVFTPKMMWKVVHCAESANVVKEYEEQKFCSDIVVGKRVKVKVTVEEGSPIPDDKLNGKPVGTKYPDKNKIDDYIKDGQVLQNGNGFVDDDINF
ncbi:MAG TPA: hypothetical protein VGJ00_10375 [Rhabdochlamydiaceae bacterium]|jgi:hypothetical protein